MAWPLSVLVPPLAVAQYQMLFRLQLELAVAQRELSAAAQLHKAARRLPGCASCQAPYSMTCCCCCLQRVCAACTRASAKHLSAFRRNHGTCPVRTSTDVLQPQ